MDWDFLSLSHLYPLMTFDSLYSNLMIVDQMMMNFDTKLKEGIFVGTDIRIRKMLSTKKRRLEFSLKKFLGNVKVYNYELISANPRDKFKHPG